MAESLDDHLRSNRKGYRLRQPGEYGGWNGPYLSAELRSDPWGKQYLVNSAFLDGGSSAADSQGKWTGLDVDYRGALAAAILGDGEKVKYVPLTAQQRFTVLQSGEVDVLARNTTWTLSRDASLGVHFVGVNYYDGQGFMVPVKAKVKSAK